MLRISSPDYNEKDEPLYNHKSYSIREKKVVTYLFGSVNAQLQPTAITFPSYKRDKDYFPIAEKQVVNFTPPLIKLNGYLMRPSYLN